MDELENERLRKLKDLHALRGEEPDADPASPDLLEQLPVGEVNLSSAPEHVLRRMFESFRLQGPLRQGASWATCRVAIREETLDQLLTDSSALSHRKRTIQTESVPFWFVPPAGHQPEGNGRDQEFRAGNSLLRAVSRLFVLPGRAERKLKCER
jgi:hypothetical protein